MCNKALCCAYVIGKETDWLYFSTFSCSEVRRMTREKIGPWGPELIWQLATKYK